MDRIVACFGTDSGWRLIALTVVACLLSSLVAMALFHRVRASRRHLHSAVEYMSQGLSMFDKEQRLIVCNRRYAELFGLAIESLKPGMTLRQIMELRIANGTIPAADPQAFVRARLATAAANKAATDLLEFPDGRVFAAVHQPTADGGWLATFEDISGRMQAEGELALARTFLTQAREDAERAAREAKAAHDRLREAFDVVPEGLVLFDADDRYVLWNRRYAEMYADGRDDLIVGRRFEDLLRLGLSLGQYPDAVGREKEWLADRLARHVQRNNSHEQWTSDGRWIRVEERRTADGGSIGVRVDITELKASEASFRLLFKSNPVSMWVYDRKTLRFLAVNEAAVEHYGYSRERFLQMSVLDLLFRADPEPRMLDRLAAESSSDAAGRSDQHLRGDGSTIEVVTYTRSLRWDDQDAAIVAAIDMTERKRAEDRIKHLAHHDALTDLPNRACFTETLTAVFKGAELSGQRFAVLCVDLDYFKQANDLFGHVVGDALLRAVAGRLQDAAQGHFLARIGGDEFTFISKAGDEPATASALAERLLAAVADDFVVDGHRIRIGLSIGIAIYPTDGASETSLVGNADAALYRAKADGRMMVRFFEAEMDERLRAIHSLHFDLRSALDRNELSLHYQPQAEVGGKVFGFEALVRWTHASRGAVAPGVFIPVAEDHGLINRIGEWVLREACREAASWRLPLRIAVNLSPIQFRHGDLPASSTRCSTAAVSRPSGSNSRSPKAC